MVTLKSELVNHKIKMTMQQRTCNLSPGGLRPNPNTFRCGEVTEQIMKKKQKILFNGTQNITQTESVLSMWQKIEAG